MPSLERTSGTSRRCPVELKTALTHRMLADRLRVGGDLVATRSAGGNTTLGPGGHRKPRPGGLYAGWWVHRRRSKAFAVFFAVGAVSGPILSFELGMLWPGMVGTFGDVWGLPFAIEGVAFFLEAIFLGIYLYGWDRFSAKAHLAVGLPIPVAGAGAAVIVVAPHARVN